MQAARTRYIALTLLLGSLACLHHTRWAGAQTEDPATLFARGSELMRRGELDQARAAFLGVVALDPLSGAAHSNLGVIAMRQKHWSDALSQLSQAQRLEPSLAGVALNIGLVYYHTNDFASAIPQFTAVLAREPASEQARYLLGLSDFFADRYQQALDVLLPLWPHQFTSLTYLYVLGSAASKVHNQALAEQAFQQMAAVGQGTPEFHLYAGKALLGKQQYQQAEAELTAAIAARPDLPMAHFFLAQTYTEEQQNEKARAALKAEIAFNPDLAFAWDELGRVELKLSHPEEARQDFQSALARDSSLSAAYVGLAQIYRDKQDYKQSLAMLDQAVDRQPNSASVHYLRGQILARLHRNAQAKAEFVKTQALLHTFNDQLRESTGTSHAADAQMTEQAAQQ